MSDQASRPPRDPLSSLKHALAPALRELRAQGHNQDAATCVQLIRERPEAAAIVVVGEANRGKSTLINALLERPGLSPTGGLETTATVVRFLPLPAGQEPWARLQLPDGDHVTVPLEELSKVADLEHLAGAIPPVGIDAHLPPGPLGEVILIDTPGVGGISGARGRINQRLIGQTGVLVFVLDAGSPLSRAELDYLIDCADVVESVVVVVSMTDKHPAGAATIVEHVRGQLAKSSIRLSRVPVVGVSAVTALTASQVPEEYRSQVLQASGLPQLHAELLRRCRYAPLFPALNALRTAREALNRIAAQMATTAAANSDDGHTAEQLAQRHAALTELQATQQRWSLDLDREFAQLRSDISRMIADRLEALGDRLAERIESVPLTGRKAFIQQLSLEVASEYELLRQDASAALTARVQGLADAWFGEHPVPAEVTSHLAGAPIIRDRPTVSPSSGEGPEAFDVIMAAPGAAGIALRVGTMQSIAGYSLVLPALNLAWPLAVVLGAGWLTFTLAYRGKQLDRRRLTTEVTRTAARERALLLEHVDAHLREVKPELVVAYRQHLNTLVTETQQQLRAAQRAKEATEQQRQAACAEARQAHDRLRGMVRDLDDAIAGALRHTDR